MTPKTLRALGATAALCLSPLAFAQVLITGVPATENFDSLASTGTTNTTLPAGWFLSEPGSNGQYVASDGAGAGLSGSVYSFGTTGSTERALGSIASGTTAPTIGAQLRNDTGALLTALQVAYTMEQWRLGTPGAADRLTFAYSTDATSLTTGTWTPVSALDAVAVVVAGTAETALDGNAAANRTAVSFDIQGLSVAANSTLWVRWSDFNDPNVDDGLAIDDISFTPPGDQPPAVVSTVPANNATGVALASNLTINFNEPVTLVGEWFAIACPTSGARAVADTVVSGGQTSWTINPNADFAEGEQCTVTVESTAVSDQDGTIDAMLQDHVFAFTAFVTPPDLAPTVASISPADGATGIAPSSNVVVTFNEPVTAPAAAFTLSCASTGMHAFALSGGSTVFTLDPDVDFGEVEVCTVTVIASQVADQDGTADPMQMNVTSSFTTRAGAGAYYDAVDTSSCALLRTTLHDLIDDHTAFPYTAGTTDTWDILEAADQDPLNASRILEVYENVPYAKAGGGNANYNREHTWPNSYGFNDLSGANGTVPASSAYTDTHMLYLSDIEYNSNRGSKPYANCPSDDGDMLPNCSPDVTQVYNGTGGGPVTYPGNHNWKLTDGGGEAFGSYEPWSSRKGDLARAVLYMDIRYEGGTATGGNTVGQSEPDLVVTDDRALIHSRRSTTSGTAYMGLKSVLLAWHAADPPDAQEVLRNDVVFSFQGNRNPFIDHPEYAECLFNCNCAPPARIFFDGFEGN